MEKRLRVLSLFDGMSCGQIALEGLGYSAKLGNLEYYASEIEQPAITVTQHNYPNTIQLGDVTKVSFKDGVLYSKNGEFEVGQFDMIIGGSPCQDISKANTKGEGLKGNKSKMFFEYYRILEEVKPRHFFFENVGGLSKEDLKVINKLLSAKSATINSNAFTAQNRTRHYWFNGNSVKIPSMNKVSIKDILDTKENISETLYVDLSKNRFIPIDNAVALPSENGLIFKGGLANSKVTQWIDNGKILSRNFRQGYRVYDEAGKSPTLTASGGGLAGKTCLIYNNGAIRRLSTEEAERLQGVPSGYTSVVSRNNALELLGNGWTVDVVAYIIGESFLNN